MNPELEIGDLVRVLLAAGHTEIYKVLEKDRKGSVIEYWIQVLNSVMETLLTSEDHFHGIRWSVVPRIGQDVEVELGPGTPTYARGRVVDVGPQSFDMVIGPGRRVMVDMRSANCSWVVIGVPTKPSLSAVKVPQGSTCRRCDNFNEYAEPDRADRTHVCTGCRHDGWHIWGDKK